MHIKYALGILVFVFFTLILTNPTLEEHKEATKLKFNSLMIKEFASENSGDLVNKLASSVGSLWGGAIVNELIDKLLNRENYLIFSLTKFQWLDENKTIGIGILGNVYLFDNLDKNLQENTK
ncbi:MAG: hypothetical protein RLZZ175_3054 [Bacteroidota bacterium]|jgi:hypothetical protein